MRNQCKMEVRKVIQWKEGCIFKTTVLKEIWVDSGLTTEQEKIIAIQNGGDFLGSLSTNRPYSEMFRTIK